MGLVVAFTLLLAVQEQHPTGEVNAVCWKFLGIAGVAIVALCGVIVVLAKKLWDTANDRIKDQLKIYESFHGKGG